MSCPAIRRSSRLALLGCLLVALLPSDAIAHPLDEVAQRWDRGTYRSPGESLQAHFEKHGREIGAADVLSYNRKAVAMLDQVRLDRWTSGSPVAGPTANVRRFVRGDRYIDVYQSGSGVRFIVSFGKR